MGGCLKITSTIQTHKLRTAGRKWDFHDIIADDDTSGLL